MDHSISGVTRGATSAHAVLPPRELGAGWEGAVRNVPAIVQPVRFGGFEPTAVGSTPASSPVRPGQIGRDGRFEKFILALQALTLDAPAAASRTDRVERMRAAAEELFGIDGLPQPVRPLGGPAAEQVSADEAAPVEPEPGAEAVKPEALEAPEEAEPPESHSTAIATEADTHAPPEVPDAPDGAPTTSGATLDAAAPEPVPTTSGAIPDGVQARVAPEA